MGDDGGGGGEIMKTWIKQIRLTKHTTSPTYLKLKLKAIKKAFCRIVINYFRIDIVWTFIA